MSGMCENLPQPLPGLLIVVRHCPVVRTTGQFPSPLRAECSGSKENQLFSDLQLNGACVSLEEAFA